MEELHLSDTELNDSLRICAGKKQRDDCFSCPMNGRSEYFNGGCRTQLVGIAAERFTKLRADNAHKRLKLKRAGRLIAELREQLEEAQSHASYMEHCRDAEKLRNQLLRKKLTGPGNGAEKLAEKAARVAAENVRLKKELKAAALQVDELKKEIAKAKKLIPVSGLVDGMTYLEALKAYNPSCISPCFTGGVLGCPDDYFTGSSAIEGERPCKEKYVSGPFELEVLCRECWERKVEKDDEA